MLHPYDCAVSVAGRRDRHVDQRHLLARPGIEFRRFLDMIEKIRANASELLDDTDYKQMDIG